MESCKLGKNFVENKKTVRNWVYSNFHKCAETAHSLIFFSMNDSDIMHEGTKQGIEEHLKIFALSYTKRCAMCVHQHASFYPNVVCKLRCGMPKDNICKCKNLKHDDLVDMLMNDEKKGVLHDKNDCIVDREYCCQKFEMVL